MSKLNRIRYGRAWIAPAVLLVACSGDDDTDAAIAEPVPVDVTVTLVTEDGNTTISEVDGVPVVVDDANGGATVPTDPGTDDGTGDGTTPVEEPVDDPGNTEPGVEEPEEEGIEIPVVLEEEASGYAELIEGLIDHGVIDANNHLDQRVVQTWVEAGITEEQMQFLFDHGDELSEISFTSADGSGSLTADVEGNIPIPRFARHPSGGRFTGPNGAACGDCHNQPLGNGSGSNVANVVQDPEPDVDGDFNVRQTRNINGDAWLQLAGTEMSLDLMAIRNDAMAQATASIGTPVSLPLMSKGISFGQITCSDDGTGAVCDYGQVEGVSPDLVVRSQGWKGNFTTIRAFSEDAFFGEMGMPSDRFSYVLSGQDLIDDMSATAMDVDNDGVIHEMSVGDITAITIYFAGQARPTTLMELMAEGKVTLTADEQARIMDGEQAFADAGCATCHATLSVSDPVFREPDTRVAAYHDMLLASVNSGYTGAAPLELDLSSSPVVERHTAAEMDPATGEMVYPVRAMTDLKRHNLGEHLCDSVKRHDAITGDYRALVPGNMMAGTELDMKIDRCEFLTADLWGISGTGPYMHDGRAATLEEAIAAHCPPAGMTGAASDSCASYSALDATRRSNLVAFLLSQLMEPEAEEEEE